jgi:hypothetical protein
VFFIIPKESVVFFEILPLFYFSCCSGVQWRYPMYVHYSAHTRITSDSSDNTSKSIHFLIMRNETLIITDVVFENMLLQWIILKCVRWKVKKLCLCSNWTVYVKHDMNVQPSEECAWSRLVARRVVLPAVHAVKTETWVRSGMKLNSCADPQKQKIGRWYVCMFFISLVSLFFVTPGRFPGAGWSHFMWGMSSW